MASSTWIQLSPAFDMALKKIILVFNDPAKDHDKWKQMIKDKQLGGIQLIADKVRKSKFNTDYGIRGISLLILINPTGNIANSDADAPKSLDKKAS